MWKYELANTIAKLNWYAEQGWEFLCTRRHPDGHDEYLVRRWQSNQADIEAPFYPVQVRQEWVVGVPGQAQAFYRPTIAETGDKP